METKSLVDLIKDTQEWVKEFKGGHLLWVDLEEALVAARDANLIPDSIGLDRRDANAILKACAFLREYRPSALKSGLAVDFRNVAYLSFIRSVMPEGPDKALKFDGIVTQVLDGSLNTEDLKDMSRTLQGKGAPVPRGTNPFPLEQLKEPLLDATRDAAALRAALQVLDYAVDRAVASNGHEKLHGIMADECDGVAVKLNCISDLMFREQWDNRKEFKI